MSFAQREISTSDKLYALMAERLKMKQESLPCTLDALSVYATEKRAQIDYLKLINLDNRSFFDACYIIAFNVFPSEFHVRMWQESINALPREEFQRKFLNSFVLLPEFSAYQVRLKNGFCMDVPRKSASHCVSTIKRTIYRVFKPFYMRFPGSIRKGLNKLLWKRFFMR